MFLLQDLSEPLPGLPDSGVIEVPTISERTFAELFTSRRDVSLEELIEVLDMVKIVVLEDGDDTLQYIKMPGDPSSSFLFGYEAVEEANGLVPIGYCLTLHEHSYYGTFKPSVEEVVRSIPADIAGEMVAFRTIGPRTSDDLARQIAAIDRGYHVAVTIVYGSAL